MVIYFHSGCYKFPGFPSGDHLLPQRAELYPRGPLDPQNSSWKLVSPPMLSKKRLQIATSRGLRMTFVFRDQPTHHTSGSPEQTNYRNPRNHTLLQRDILNATAPNHITPSEIPYPHELLKKQSSTADRNHIVPHHDPELPPQNRPSRKLPWRN